MEGRRQAWEELAEDVVYNSIRFTGVLRFSTTHKKPFEGKILNRPIERFKDVQEIGRCATEPDKHHISPESRSVPSWQ